MIRRLGMVGALAATLVAISAPAANAAQPPGPRLAYEEWRLKKPVRTRLLSVSAEGSNRLPLAGVGAVEPTLFNGASWSADGSSFVFSGRPRGSGDHVKSRVYISSPNGLGPRPIRGTVAGTHPVLSPDGATVAFSRSRLKFHFNPKRPLDFHSYESTSAWIVGVAGGKARQLTPWRNGLHVSPTSFSADSRRLILDRNRRKGPEVVLRELDGGLTTVLVREAESAVLSPDGSRLALISYRDHIASEVDGDGLRAKGELYVANADGSDLRRVTKTRDWQEGQPSWDPSGLRLAYTRTSGPEWLALGTTNVVMEINSDGTCPMMVVGKPRTEKAFGPGLYAPTWQPGPGREAGSIAC